MKASVSPHKRARGAQARASGRSAEILAAFWLMAKGWRILALRHKSRGAEIDLLARKGSVLAVVEVKRRATLAQALAAVSTDQRDRLRQAGAGLLGRPGMSGLSVRLDLVAFAPGRFPRHIADAWPDEGSRQYGATIPS